MHNRRKVYLLGVTKATKVYDLSRITILNYFNPPGYLELCLALNLLPIVGQGDALPKKLISQALSLSLNLMEKGTLACTSLSWLCKDVQQSPKVPPLFIEGDVRFSKLCAKRANG